MSPHNVGSVLTDEPDVVESPLELDRIGDVIPSTGDDGSRSMRPCLARLVPREPARVSTRPGRTANHMRASTVSDVEPSPVPMIDSAPLFASLTSGTLSPS